MEKIHAADLRGLAEIAQVIRTKKSRRRRACQRLFLSDAERNRLKAQPSLWGGRASLVSSSSAWRERGAHRTRSTIQIGDAFAVPFTKLVGPAAKIAALHNLGQPDVRSGPR